MFYYQKLGFVKNFFYDDSFQNTTDFFGHVTVLFILITWPIASVFADISLVTGSCVFIDSLTDTPVQIKIMEYSNESELFICLINSFLMEHLGLIYIYQ